jgi:hypothetical protein
MPTVEPTLLREWLGQSNTKHPDRLLPGEGVQVQNLALRDGLLRKLPGNRLYGVLVGAQPDTPCTWVGRHVRQDGTVDLLAYGQHHDGKGRLYRCQEPLGDAQQPYLALTPELHDIEVPNEPQLVEGVQLHRTTYFTDLEQLWLYRESEEDPLLAFEPLNLADPQEVPLFTRHPGPVTFNACQDNAGWVTQIVSGDGLINLSISAPPEPSPLGGGTAWPKVCPWPEGRPRRHLLFGLGGVTGQTPTRLHGLATYTLPAPVDLTATGNQSNVIHFLLSLPTLSGLDTYQQLTADGSADTFLRVKLYDGPPGDPGTKELSFELTECVPGLASVIANEWLVVTVTKAAALAKAALAPNANPDFWKQVRAVGLEVSCELVENATATHQAYFSVFLGGIYAPGLLAEVTDPFQVGYTLYNASTGAESALSPTVTVDLFDQSEAVQAAVHAERSTSLWGAFYLSFTRQAYSPAPTHYRVYGNPGGTWRLLAEKPYVSGPGVQQLDVNQDPNGAEQRTPQAVASADIAPFHLGVWTQSSRLVALGCRFEGQDYRERVWISNWLRPQEGAQLYWPQQTYAGDPELTLEKADQGMFFDVPGARELVAGREFSGWFFVFGKGGLWTIQGLDASDYKLEALTGAVGCRAGRSVVEVPRHGLAWLGTDNVVYVTTGESVEPLTRPGEPFPMKGLLDRMDDRHLDACEATYHDGRLFLLFPGSEGPLALLCDLESLTWCEWLGTRPRHGLSVTPNLTDPDQDDPLLLTGCQSSPVVLSLMDPRVEDDLGNPMEVVYRTGILRLAEAGKTRLRCLRAEVELPLGSGPLPLRFRFWDEHGDPLGAEAWAVADPIWQRLRVECPAVRWVRGAQVELQCETLGGFALTELGLFCDQALRLER